VEEREVRMEEGRRRGEGGWKNEGRQEGRRL
jgi:hypothetical protein